jgi:hypothetical protein
LGYLEVGRWIERLSGEVGGKVRSEVGKKRYLKIHAVHHFGIGVYTYTLLQQKGRLQTPLFWLEVFQRVEDLNSPERFFRKHLADFRMRYPNDYVLAPSIASVESPFMPALTPAFTP